MGQNTMPNVHAISVKFCEYFLLLLLCVHVIPLFEYWFNNKVLCISSTWLTSFLNVILCDALVLNKRRSPNKRRTSNKRRSLNKRRSPNKRPHQNLGEINKRRGA